MGYINMNIGSISDKQFEENIEMLKRKIAAGIWTREELVANRARELRTLTFLPGTANNLKRIEYIKKEINAIRLMEVE